MARNLTRIVLGMGLALTFPGPVLSQYGNPIGQPGGGSHTGTRVPQRRAELPDAPKPVKRERLDKLVEGMFREADADRNGSVTVAEVRARVEARRATLIRDRFARIDRDHNGALSLAEFIAWQEEMGSVASSEAQRTPGIALTAESIAPELSDDPGDRALSRIIEPLGATTIANADTNYDGGVTLDELRAYERKRFDAIDLDHDGELSFDELRALREERRGPDGREP